MFCSEKVLCGPEPEQRFASARPRHAREATEHQPCREGTRKMPWSENAHGLRAHRSVEGNVPQPDARHGREVSFDLKINVVTGVLDA